MGKRIVVLFFIVTAALCGLSVRIISVNAGEFAKTAAYSNSRTIPVATSRGIIYDCNMERMVSSQDEYAVAVKPTAQGLNSVSGYMGEEKMREVRADLAKGNPVLLRLSQRPECGQDTQVIAYKRRYSDKQLAKHLVGYLDAEGNGVTGIEKSFNDYLSDDAGTLKAAFYVDALGRNLKGAEIEVIDDGYSSEKGIVLTIDLRVQKALEDAMDSCFINSGCAVAVDPKTGAVRAMVSRPNYDQLDVAASLKSENSPLVNKALMAYSVGSTFKVVVSAAALEEGPLSKERSFDCKGVINVGGKDFGCYGRTAHGNVSMNEALIHSCNTYFISLAEELGSYKILQTAKKMGFGTQFTLCKNVVSREGKLPASAEVSSEIDTANLGFGQGSLLATPLQLASAFSTIANGGYFTEPSLIMGYVDESGSFTQTRTSVARKRVLRSGTCKSLSDMLQNVVLESPNTKPERVTAAGKTATAQTGQFDSDREICHSWFAGWYPVSNPELVIVIMKENGASGNADCAPVFKKVVDTLTTEVK